MFDEASTQLAEAPVNISEKVDREVVRQEFTKVIKEVAKLVSNIDYVRNKRDKTPADERVIRLVDLFLATYKNRLGFLRQDKIDKLTDKVVSRIDTIHISELVDTAKKIVDEAAGEQITMFIPNKESKEAHFDSPNSTNSNEFMIKLVQKFAEKAGKKVVIVSNENDLQNYQEVVFADDAIYSGDQLSTRIDIIGQYIETPLKIKLYCARATNLGEKNIQEKAAYHPNLQVEEHLQNITQSIWDSLLGNPEVLSYFLVKGMSGFLKEKMNTGEVIGRMMDYVQGETLTVLETKTPDFLSFPKEVAVGLPENKKQAYPSIDTLKF